MTSKCHRCGKTVYFAEKQSYDGKDFHGNCLQAFRKDLKAGVSGQTMGFSSYPTSNSGGGSSDSASFCAGCGAKAGGGEKFCANCGNAL